MGIQNPSPWGWEEGKAEEHGWEEMARVGGASGWLQRTCQLGAQGRELQVLAESLASI